MEQGHKKIIAAARPAIVLIDRIPARDPLRTRSAGKLDSNADRFRAWASFVASDGLLLSAVLVLAAARGLRRLRLIGPAGSLTAIAVSQYLVQRGMRIWRREWVTLRGGKR
jgi:hypothetical protein